MADYMELEETVQPILIDKSLLHTLHQKYHNNEQNVEAMVTILGGT